MAEGKTPKNASELLKALHEFVLGPEEAEVTALPPEEVQAALRVEGMDTTPLVRHVRERLSKIELKMNSHAPVSNATSSSSTCNRTVTSLQVLPLESRNKSSNV